MADNYEDWPNYAIKIQAFSNCGDKYTSIMFRRTDS